MWAHIKVIIPSMKDKDYKGLSDFNFYKYVTNFIDDPLKTYSRESKIYSCLKIFDWYTIRKSDCMKVSKISDDLLVWGVMVIVHKDLKEATTLLLTEIWNGTMDQKTHFSGNVKEAISIHNKNYQQCNIDNRKIENDWLCVGVDLHI